MLLKETIEKGVRRMTDDMERYYYWKDGNWKQISDECTTNNFYTLEQCANELNKLNDENEQLKDLIIHLGYTIKYDEYRHITLELKE